jgi:hypothetical protein
VTSDHLPGASGAYLKQVSELNPMWRATDLINLRSQTLGIPRCDTTATDAVGDLSQLREAFKNYLARIQTQFWQLPQPLLLQQLAAIDTQKLPELAAVVQRLRTVAECRGQFPKLAQEPWMVASLFHALKTAVVLPQSAAGIVRERYTRSFASRKELKAVQQAIVHIEQQYPQLYQLERDLFLTLQKLELVRAQHASTSAGSYGLWQSNYSWLVVICVFILIRAIVAYLRVGVSSQ